MNDFELVRLGFDELEPSPEFTAWLAQEGLSVAITKGNSLCLVGLDQDGSLSFVERQFGNCMGLESVGSNTLYLATRYQIWRLENAIPEGQLDGAGHDRLYLPQTAWTTGTLLVRDLALMDDGELVFVNGLFSCLCSPSLRLNFEPTWLPPFISSLGHEDRCHLSGVALAQGRPAFVTSGSTSDQPAGWREHQRDGGVVVSVQTGDLICKGLSMPNSPRLSDGLLWLCVGGSGRLGVLDPADGRITEVTELPGFARGLALRGKQAVVATSRPQRGETFDGLPLSERLSGDGAGGRCGIFVIDRESGRIEHSLLFAGGASQIHAVALLPQVRRATAVPFTGDDVQELVTVGSE